MKLWDYQKLTNELLSLFLTLTLLTVSVSGAENVNFTSSEEIKTVHTGQDVYFECSVVNQGSRAVRWFYLKYHRPISSNTTILDVSARSNRYEIFQPLGSEGHYTLVIKSVQAEDGGDYMCEVQGTKQIHTLVIEDAAVPPVSDFPRANFTECCLKENIRATCLPACSPSTLDLTTFDGKTACAGDFLKILKCGADERNHVNCCRRRHIITSCLDMCLSYPTVEHTRILQCLSTASDIVMCFEEGQHLLPTSPMFVSAEPLSSDSVFVKWELPAENPEKLHGYIVFYRKRGDVDSRNLQLNTTGSTTDGTNVIIRNLEANSLYDFYVSAFNHHGSSLPSYTVEVFTQNGFKQGGQDLFQCCQNRQVLPRCQGFLCQGNMSLTPNERLSCYTEVNKVFACLSAEQNHSTCCIAKGIRPECLKLCAGDVHSLGFEDASCLQEMDRIAPCFAQGKETLPGPPTYVKLLEVGETNAKVEWNPPALNAEKATGYRTEYWEYGTENTVQVETAADVLRAELTGLKASTKYEVMVSSLGERGTSLPSVGLIFLTYSPYGVWLQPVHPTLSPTSPAPVDLPQCCRNAEVATDCMGLCSYSAAWDSVDDLTLLRCEASLPKIIRCAIDGRNHTNCCVQRHVDSRCWKFCSFTMEEMAAYTFRWADKICLQHIGTIIECMQEGIASIPSSPREQSVVDVTAHTVSLYWKPPQPVPTGYIVHYRPRDDSAKPWTIERTNASHFILQNLKPLNVYEIEVMAYNQQGASLPGPQLIVRTPPDLNISPLLNFTMPANVSECCIAKNVSVGCVKYCYGNDMLNLHECSADLGPMMECAADGRNHRECCQRGNVPESCRGFCEGRPKVEDYLGLLCLTHAAEMSSCFQQGFYTLPSQPRGFTCTFVGPDYADFSWDPPSRQSQNVRYYLYYQKIGYQSYYSVNASSPMRIENLEPFQHYEFDLLALNQYGASLPTTISIFTLPQSVPGDIIKQIPSGDRVDEFSNVTLMCSAPGLSTNTIYWLHNSLPHKSANYTINHVTRNDTGRYTCVAKYGTGQMSTIRRNWFLKVQHSPEVFVLKRQLKMEPDKQLTAHMQCNFTGFPDIAKIYWMQNNVRLSHSKNPRVIMNTIIQEEDGIIEARLAVMGVRDADFGIYRCSASNNYGNQHADISLANSLLHDTVTLPPFIPAPKQPNVTACCVRKEVSDQCVPACKFDLDMDALKDPPFSCLKDLPDLIHCGADGRNHTACCSKAKVPTICLPICSGIFNTNMVAPDQLKCLEHIRTMVACMKEGHRNIPGAPRNFKGVLTQGFIAVWWDAPEVNPELVEHYEISYRDTKQDITQVITVSSKVRRTNLKAIHGSTTYVVNIKATNHNGESHISHTLKIPTYELRPSAPRNLRGKLVSGSYVRLDWDSPLENPGSVLKYKIYFAPVPSTDYEMETSEESTYRLEHLEAYTSYRIYVISVSSHFESDPSESITIRTKEHHNIIEQQKGGVNQVGLGVGLAFALVFILVVAAVLVWYFRLRQIPHERFKEDAVSFENPSYASAGDIRIRGLPGDSMNSDPGHQPSSRNPDSVIMKEVPDNTSDQGYSTLSHPNTTPPKTENQQFATIPVTQLEAVGNGKVKCEDGGGSPNA